MNYRDQLFPTQHQQGCQCHICHFILSNYCWLKNSMLFQPVRPSEVLAVVSWGFFFPFSSFVINLSSLNMLNPSSEPGEEAGTVRAYGQCQGLWQHTARSAGAVGMHRKLLPSGIQMDSDYLHILHSFAYDVKEWKLFFFLNHNQY